MTDPTGRSFLSYRRVRKDEAALLIRAQKDIGVPTWQDITDLQEGFTEESLKAVLTDPTTANVILWITPELRDSVVVQRVEIPAIFHRLEAEDEFFAIAVAAGGLDYGTAGKIVKGETSIRDLSNWNLRHVANNPVNDVEALQVATYVLERRIRAIRQSVPANVTLRIGIYTRVKSRNLAGYSLIFDWVGKFSNREASSDDWVSLLANLSLASSAIHANASDRNFVADGLASLSACFALGSRFLAPSRISISWKQFMPNAAEQLWSIREAREASGFVAKASPSDPTSKELAVLVSITNDVVRAFRASDERLPKFRAILEIKKYGVLPHQIPNPAQAVDVAILVRDSIKKAQHEYGGGPIHLFMAVPAGIAFLIGQLSNTLGNIQTYEHVPDGADGLYAKAAWVPAA